MFLDRRVYQGSSGKVYPLPFIDRISEEKKDQKWEAVHLENEFIKLMILPQIGGRIHVGEDKTNGYDFFYRQDVIKPALVGLAGPWISGGVEFNWPQHHRPSTFMPTDVAIEEHADGSKTVWLSEHEPMNRMKGMHGVCLHPGKSFIELKARVYNRTPLVQTFLWWVNVATRVHEHYQSFFPPDVSYVADHARRSMSEFPHCEESYYGVDYKTRGRKGVPCKEVPRQFISPGTYAANDLSWYANIPVPTSYMAMGTSEDFFGGYDHGADAGVVHISNRHISPGKKQWTWGNHEFGYAWDRNLTEADARGKFPPYIELMAGVYTENQPDFSFLAPGETKTWSQFLVPIRAIGVAQQANLDAAVSLQTVDGKLRVGVAVSSVFKRARIELQRRSDRSCLEGWERDLSPAEPFFELSTAAPDDVDQDLRLVVSHHGREIIDYSPKPAERGKVPPPATEPPLPADLESNEELYITGLHLQQYRHATRQPEPYWREALRRDAGDARCNQALGLWHLRRGEFIEAEAHFRRAIERLTKLNPNPSDGEPFYHLGLALRHQGRVEEAYAAFYKATWNQAWQSAGYHALAELDGRQGEWAKALEHLDRALRLNSDQLKARNLRAIALRKLGRNSEAEEALVATLALDPLDWWARYLLRGDATSDAQTRLDIALDFANAGLHADAIEFLQMPAAGAASDARELGTAPLIGYYLGWFYQRLSKANAAREQFDAAATAHPDYCFPARLEEIAILQAAIAANPRNARAYYYLGNLFYDRGRREEAIKLWEKSARLDSRFSIVWRNLGIAYFNVAQNSKKASRAYEKALRANPRDARLLYERDQLWKRLGAQPTARLKELEKRPHLVRERDDLSVELCALYNQTGQPEKALTVLSSRNFQPWEGGEGQSLGQHVRTQLALGRKALETGNPQTARDHFALALTSPRNLGEAKHLLANQSDIHYWLGVAEFAVGNKTAARKAWTTAATFRGDFQEMSLKPFSEMTYYTALSLQRLGKRAPAERLLQALLGYAQKLEKTPAKIDYFATSLPTMLVFFEDIQFRQKVVATFLQAQALLGLGRLARANKLLEKTLALDPNHSLAVDLLADARSAFKISKHASISAGQKQKLPARDELIYK